MVHTLVPCVEAKDNKKASVPDEGFAGSYLPGPSPEGPPATYVHASQLFMGKKKTGDSFADIHCLPAYSPAGSPTLPSVNLPFHIHRDFLIKIEGCQEKFLCDSISAVSHQTGPDCPK
jgi:hypothetical protein